MNEHCGASSQKSGRFFLAVQLAGETNPAACPQLMAQKQLGICVNLQPHLLVWPKIWVFFFFFTNTIFCFAEQRTLMCLSLITTKKKQHEGHFFCSGFPKLVADFCESKLLADSAGREKTSIVLHLGLRCGKTNRQYSNTGISFSHIADQGFPILGPISVEARTRSRTNLGGLAVARELKAYIYC